MREFAKGQYIFVSIPTGMESCGCLLPVFHSLCGVITVRIDLITWQTCILISGLLCAGY